MVSLIFTERLIFGEHVHLLRVDIDSVRTVSREFLLSLRIFSLFTFLLGPSGWINRFVCRGVSTAFPILSSPPMAKRLELRFCRYAKRILFPKEVA